MTKRVTSPTRKILLVDTTNRDETRLALVDNQEAVTLERPVRAQELQAMMAELLEKTGTNWPDLQAIAVLTGPGSFTGTRIGITAANTLGWLYRLPLIPLADKDFEGSIALLHSTSLPQTTRTILPSE